MNEDFTFNNSRDFFQSANPLIKLAIKNAIAAPFMPITGINKKFNIMPTNNEIPHHLQATFSLPVIFIIDPIGPNIELKNGERRIKKKVIFGIKKSDPKYKITNFL